MFVIDWENFKQIQQTQYVIFYRFRRTDSNKILNPLVSNQFMFFEQHFFLTIAKITFMKSSTWRDHKKYPLATAST